MLQRTLNLGILAHVDAGKTTLTERLLFAAGIIDAPGSVDRGTTQTDSLELERQRGITIRSAVVSFEVDDVVVNLIDTPGHPDFIAEVERVLGVLDGAVLVVSAVEGVQAQTRILMRALQRLRIPTLLFVNKIDRGGAGCDRVVRDIAARLTPAAVPVGAVDGEGTRSASVAVRADDVAVVAQLAEDGGGVHPVFFGSAITGAGVDALTHALTTLLPAVRGDADAPLSAGIFKIDRGAGGERVAYARVFTGTVRIRDRVPIGERDGKVTTLAVFERGAAVPAVSAPAGRICTLRGLGDVRIGDAIGMPRPAPPRVFGPPTLETVVVARRPSDRERLRTALVQLAEQDPLIDVRQDDEAHALHLSLYGEVQKEVVEATLANDFGVAASFSETTTICVERPVGRGDAVERLGEPTNPFLATIGVRVERAAADTGIELRLDVDVESVPLYVYKTVESFRAALEETARATLAEGLYGWRITDCAVTVVESGYSSPGTGAGDFRKLLPLVLTEALARAGTEVCEPIHRFRLDGPADTLQATLRVLAQLGAEPHDVAVSNSAFAVEGEIAAARTHVLQRRLGGLTRGEGTVEFEFARYERTHGPPPVRARSAAYALDREAYLLRLAGRVG